MKSLLTGMLMTGGLLSACSEATDYAVSYPVQTASFAVRTGDYVVDGASSVLPGEQKIKDMQVYHFKDGRLERVFENVQPVSEQNYRLDVTGLSGRLYFLANGTAAADVSAIVPAMSEADFLRLTADGPFDGSCVMTGQQELGGSQSDYELSLTRGMARLDLQLQAPHTVVKDVTVEQAAQGGYVWPQTVVATPDEAVRETLCRSFDRPLSADSAGIFYLYEQAGEPLTVRLTVAVRGKEKVVEGQLPTMLKRNTVYVVKLTGDDVAHLALEVEEWESGDDVNVVPELGRVVRVDRERSELPDGVTVRNEAAFDVVELPYYPVELLLTLEAPAEVELLKVDGGLQLTLETAAPPVSSYLQNTFRVNTALSVPGKPAGEAVYAIKYKHLDYVYEDKLVFRQQANASRFDGMLTFDDDMVCDLKRYVDNELGTVAVPDGMELSVRVEDGNAPWLKAEPLPDASGSYRIVAGWRPNDPEADGREQRADLLIRTSDGSREEVYTVKRRNYGLPVTLMNGVYWCKYNARGNARDFADQILVPDDPAAQRGQTVREYLDNCPPEAYLDLWGWNYQGGSGRGLKVTVQDGVAKLEGYNTAETVHPNRLDPKSLAPDGYELPDMAYYNRIFPEWASILRDGGPYTVHTPWENNRQVFIRSGSRTDLVLDGLQLPELYHFEVYDKINGQEQEAVTFYGPGSQWNNNGLNHNNILFGCYSPAGSGWFNSNYGLQVNGGGPRDTRIFRFVKSPVEYIY